MSDLHARTIGFGISGRDAGTHPEQAQDADSHAQFRFSGVIL